ncbi:MAG: hypothetical protein K0S41_1578 [Anaerocolumna sp.]|jgi:hypothetical protein|nr:hypothetical protein [Anaerocolumna sp.]
MFHLEEALSWKKQDMPMLTYKINTIIIRKQCNPLGGLDE